MDLGEPLADEGGCVYPRMDCPDDRYLRGDTGGNEARIYRAGEDDGVIAAHHRILFHLFDNSEAAIGEKLLVPNLRCTLDKKPLIDIDLDPFQCALFPQIGHEVM